MGKSLHMPADSRYLQAVAVLWSSLLLCLVSGAAVTTRAATSSNEFPEGFLMGAGTSAYQVEGGWNADGKGESIWDRLLHTRPNYTADGQNADVAADSYHKYKDDVAALHHIGADVYRFSISWTRILPTGDLSSINKPGIDYYNNLIDSLLQKGIIPLVTMYHWDLPHKLQELGGWTNPYIIDNFVDYAEVLFDNFGDRVKWWVTFNQPDYVASGYTSTTQAPALNASGIGDYLAGYTLLLAHAQTWRMYDERYRATQKGKVGITLNIDWVEPASDTPDDIAAAERSLQFTAGVWAHPILSQKGDYPEVVRKRVDANSRAEGRLRSRLPRFTSEEIDYIKGTADFVALNHYTTFLAASGESGSIPSKVRDTGSIVLPAMDFPTTYGSSWLRIAPMGIRKTLNWLNVRYPGYPIFITENGCSDDGRSLDDQQRITYFRCYFSEVLRAINEDGINVLGYVVWSLIDNFEWEASYTSKFGVFHVDFNDPERPRTAKTSAAFLKEIFGQKRLPTHYFVTDTSLMNSTCYVWPDAQTRTNIRDNEKMSLPRRERMPQERSNHRRSRNRERQVHPTANHTSRVRTNS